MLDQSTYFRSRPHSCKMLKFDPCTNSCFVHITRCGGKISALFSDNGTRAFYCPSDNVCARFDGDSLQASLLFGYQTFSNSKRE